MSRTPDLRLIVITDRALAAPRALLDVVRACLAAGAPAVQLRDKGATARELFDQAVAFRALTREYDALLFVNDRLDVALAAGADGVHLGPGDMPVAAARRAAPARFLIGWSTDDPDTAARAERDGADYIGCGAVFGTTSKPEVGEERIGVERLRTVVDAVQIPVIAIGGIDTSNVSQIPPTGASGIAVIGALMNAPDPGAATSALIRHF